MRASHDTSKAGEQPGKSSANAANIPNGKQESEDNAKFLKEQLAVIRDLDRLLKINPDDADTSYNRGLANLIVGNYDAAANDFKRFLTTVAWRGQATEYAGILCALGEYGTKNKKEADKALQEVEKNAKSNSWPLPIVQYLLGKCTEEQVYEQAKDKFQATTARCYIGLALLYGGNTDKGLENLRWMESHGDKRMQDYFLGQSSLRLRQTIDKKQS